MAATMRRVVIFGHMKTCKLCSHGVFFRQKHAINKVAKLPTQQQAVLCRDIDVDEDVGSYLEGPQFKYKEHPGKMYLKTVHLPERLEKTIQNIAEEYRGSAILKEATKLKMHLHMRFPASEEGTTAKLLTDVKAELAAKHTSLLTEATGEQRQKMEADINYKALTWVKQNVYNWVPLSYEGYKVVVYMVARVVENYASYLQILSEIHKRDESFTPRDVYDFGSGLGTGVWAVYNIWGRNVFNYYCVDQSGDMNDMARLILQDGNQQKSMIIRGVSFHQFQPSDKNTFELVLCGHTLLDLPSRSERLAVIESLWRKTEKYLVLVEQGSQVGYELMLEARDHILQMQGEGLDGHTFAPCSHDSGCPKLEFIRKPCTFDVPYKPLTKLNKITEQPVKDMAKYTYIVMKKGPRQKDERSWPRVLYPVQKRHGMLQCHTCCPDGSYRNFVVTKKKHSKELFNCVKYCTWGDLLPVSLGKYDPATWQDKSAGYHIEEDQDQISLKEDNSVTEELETVISREKETQISAEDIELRSTGMSNIEDLSQECSTLSDPSEDSSSSSSSDDGENSDIDDDNSDNSKSDDKINDFDPKPLS